jgi:hypothetical protein
MVVLPGLMLSIVLAMLDNMIVGTAMPRIVGELGDLSQLSWVVTAAAGPRDRSTPVGRSLLVDGLGASRMIMIPLPQIVAHHLR